MYIVILWGNYVVYSRYKDCFYCGNIVKFKGVLVFLDWEFYWEVVWV